MQNFCSTHLLLRQPFGRENCGPKGRYFLDLLEPSGPFPQIPNGQHYKPIHLVEDRDAYRNVPRQARFYGPGVDTAFSDAQSVLVVLFEPGPGGLRLGSERWGDLQEAAVSELMSADGRPAVVIKTTPDRLGFWTETSVMFGPRSLRLRFTDAASGVSEIARLVAA